MEYISWFNHDRLIVFGFLLLGISRGRTAKRLAERYALFTLSGLCGVFVLAVAAIGIYALTQKPSSAKPKPKATAALPANTTPHRLPSGPRPE